LGIEKQASILGEYVEKYKEKFGEYPENLETEFFNNAPHRTYLGTKFKLDNYTDRNEKDTIFCVINFSLGDYIGHYNTRKKRFYYSD
jgi:hypothetical protein